MTSAALLRVLLAGFMLFASAASSQTAQRDAADAALVERVKKAVIKDLRESGALDREVDASVERYVERQRSEQAARERGEQQARAAALRRVSKSRDHIRGNPDAPVTLIEYSDFECPFCKSFHPTLKKAVDESNGQVRWVYGTFLSIRSIP